MRQIEEIHCFTVTYQIPGCPVVTSKGHSAHGVGALMNAVLLSGGWGSSIRTSALKQIKRDEMFVRGAARAVRGRFYARLQGVNI